MINTQSGPFIVTGASGHLGREVIKNLLAAGVGPIIAVTRSPEKLADITDKGIEARKGDFNDPASLGPGICQRQAPADHLDRRPGTG